MEPELIAKQKELQNPDRTLKCPNEKCKYTLSLTRSQMGASLSWCPVCGWVKDTDTYGGVQHKNSRKLKGFLMRKNDKRTKAYSSQNTARDSE